jgi:hypothetical protein
MWIKKEASIMRKALMTLTAIAALAGAGLVSKADAAPTRIEGATVQTVQYYGGGHERWREHEWRRHERRRAWHHWHHWHRGW